MWRHYYKHQSIYNFFLQLMYTRWVHCIYTLVSLVLSLLLDRIAVGISGIERIYKRNIYEDLTFDYTTSMGSDATILIKISKKKKSVQNL